MGFFQGFIHSDINPKNDKSRTLPILNIKDKYGRTFHLSWIGFFVAFLSWFAFPPLLHGFIQKDLELTQAQIANSNIIALLATLLVRFTVGPLCDRYGPRYVMIGCLLIGAIPTALTPFIRDASHLFIIRFFIGILGGTFVPCQVWTSQFFDKNIIGLTNALAAGFGNSGGGVTYYVMPKVVSSLMNNHGISQYWAWRLAFPLCPLVIIICVSIIILAFGHDTPTGPWSARNIKQNTPTLDKVSIKNNTSKIPLVASSREVSKEPLDVCIYTIEDEIPQVPTTRDIIKTTFSLQTLLVSMPYLSSFGCELSVQGIISNLYIQTTLKQGIVWDSETVGKWAAIFGLVNIIARPTGGYFSDVLYQYKGLVAKKWLVICFGIMNNIFLIWIGFADFKIYPLIGAMTALAIFIQAGNGAIFALVPAIHPKFNGIIAGVTGASGNIGGVLFNIVFWYLGTNYYKALWMIGFFCLGSNIALTFIPLR